MDELFELVIYNDSTTPFKFVAELLCRLSGKPMYECEELTRRINNAGQHALGPFPESVAKAIQNEAIDIIKQADQSLKIECVSTVNRSEAGLICCSFCSKPSSDVAKMIGGKDGAILR